MTDAETRVQICYTSSILDRYILDFRVKSKSYQEPKPALTAGDDEFSKLNEINFIKKNFNS